MKIAGITFIIAYVLFSNVAADVLILSRLYIMFEMLFRCIVLA